MENKNSIGATLDSIIYDCDDPKTLADFYAKLLGGRTIEGEYGDYAVSVPGSGVNLAFQYDEYYKRPVWLGSEQDQQQMMHIDIRVNDIQQAVDFALTLGAKMPSRQFCQPEWEVQWITLFDPAGHPFCFFEK